EGNAVVAIKKGSDIVWSYHIWVTDYDGSATYANTYNTNNNGKNFVFMDRNLGATKAGLLTSSGTGANAGFGLFYQWGRKDPFPATLAPGATQPGSGTFTATATSSSNGTVAYTLKNPNTFLTAGSSSSYDWYYGSRDNALWGHSGVKTIYDPCPSGWRVPKNSGMSEATSPWKGFTSSNGTWSYGYNWGTNTRYPAAGSRGNSSGSIGNEGSYGVYWSASPSSSSSNNASNLNVYSGYVRVDDSRGRATGLSVRCAQE
ncbi:MAG: fibrobacter succinogenes major paralogous domain-containing protein, partial [Mediterranea sp.]|nr:fibrobacter succinogenes major paralogous domain-containing protein [Mediterranea sp.]